MGEGRGRLVPEPRAPDPRGIAVSEEVEGGERTDHDLLHGETTAAEPGVVEQHPPGDDRADEKPGARAGKRRHPLQLDPSRYHRYRPRAQPAGLPRAEER